MSQINAADAVAAAREAGLRYVSDNMPGIHRRRAGKGFRYFWPDGTPVTDPANRDRIRGLAIPPAWTDVWISPIARGHIQATGRDAKDRKQYVYNPTWRQFRDETKYNRMTAFGEALPGIREALERDLGKPGLARERVLATVVRLLDETAIRVGNDEYARANQSYGLTTLEREHVAVSGATLHFRFRGKWGKERAVDVRDRRVARIVQRLEDLPGQELFQYLDPRGELRSIESSDVNAYLHQIAGDEFTAKDFRTWHGTVRAAQALRDLGPGDTKTRTKRNVGAAIKAAAQHLGNTPTICRKCYVNPVILDAYHDGTLARAFSSPIAPRPGLTDDEAAVLELLCERAGDPTRRAA